MSAAALPRKRFTRDEVEHMLELGLFAGQRFELIDGDLIDKMGQLPPHSQGIRLILKLLVKIFGSERVQVQLPMEVSADERKYTIPEPDLAVLAGSDDELGSRHPAGDEMVLVVEVSDTTLRYDMTGKRDLYARAGVPEYWVLNPKGRKLVVHRNPKQGKYASTTALTSRDSVSIGGQSLRIADMLP